MAVLAIYNYQFAKIIKNGREGMIFPDDGLEMDAQASFPKRQEIFGYVLGKDFRNEERIHFCSRYSGDKEFIHGYITEPQDDIYVLRIANKRTTTIVTEDLKERSVDDYQNCIVIIDNRPGIQRILIEDKKSAFSNTKQVGRILEYTFNKVLNCYSLKLELMHLQNPKAFWDLTNDKKSYPDGFYKITFHLPHLNLERLRKVFDKVLVMSREVFDSDLEWSYKANEGGKLMIDEKNQMQKELIDWLMKDVGDENIKLYSNANKRKPIVVGHDSFLTTAISDRVFKTLEEEAKTKSLFASGALDEIKMKTKTGIDLNDTKNDQNTNKG